MDALIYLTLCSIRNRFRVRFRRLKEPRYLIGLVVGLGYFWTVFLRPSPRLGSSLASTQTSRQPIEVVFSAVLFLLCAVSWIPGGRKRPALSFSQADVHFLFPAPFTRTQLIHYKLLRSLSGALVGSLFMKVVFSRSGLSSHWMFFVGMTMTMMCLNLHLTGISLSRESLGSHGFSGFARQWLPVAAVVAAVSIFVIAIAADWPTLSSLSSLGVIEELVKLGSAGAPGIVLWPFRVMLRLPLARTSTEFLQALPWALGILALNYVWVVRSDARFEEASAELAERTARIGRGQRLSTPKVKLTRVPFKLSLEGPAETAILWKNLILVGRYLSIRTLLRLLPLFVLISILGRFQRGASSGNGIAALCGIAFVITVLVGPLVTRNDLRQDLANLVVLKTWPVRGATLVRGEVLAPAALLTLIAWLTALGVLIFDKAGGISPSWIVSAALLSPCVIVLQLLAQNAVAVLWPSWVVTGTRRVRGIEVMGQRLVMMVGFLLVLLVAALPAAIVGGLVTLGLYTLTRTIIVPVSAIAAAVVLLGEAFVASEAIGKMLDHTDVSALDVQE